MADVEYVTNTTAFDNLNVKGNESQIGYAERVVSHKMGTLKWVVLAGRSGTDFASG